MASFLGNRAPLEEPRTEDDLIAIGISTPKEDRFILKMNDIKGYDKLRNQAEKGITSKFDLLKPIDKSNLDTSKETYKIMTRVADLEKDMKRSELEDVFNIPFEFNEHLPKDGTRSVHLFEEHNEVTTEQVKAANKFYFKYGDEFHAENIKWSGEKVLNSCSVELREKIIEVAENFDPSEKGGPVYFKIMMDLIIATSETAMRSIINQINEVKLSQFPADDVLQFASYIRGAILLLRNHKAVPHDICQLIYKGLRQGSCEEFNDYITAMMNSEKLTGVKKKSDEILSLAETEYTDLVGREEWTAKSTKINQGSTFYNETGRASLGTMCYNCGSLDHLLKECPLPF